VNVTPAGLPGVFVLDVDVYEDARGSFEAPWERGALAKHGLETELAQASLATNRGRGTIRGLHFQAEPHQEVKIVRAVRGAIWDVAVDLRASSPTFGRWCGVELSAANRRMLYLPKGVAHGYQTLEDDTDVLYFVSAAYQPYAQRGLRWDDPAVDIEWPLGAPAVLSDRDYAWPSLDELRAQPAAERGTPVTVQYAWLCGSMKATVRLC
jgi:dTDP-4-dehydrorhamnose 3,5-epimerase